MKAFFTLCLSFLAVPLMVVGVLGVAEFIKPAPAPGAFLLKMSLALAGIGLGSVIPYISSDDALYLKFATITTENQEFVMSFDKAGKESFDLVRKFVLIFFICGMVIWLANYFIPESLSFSQFPTLVRWFWITGVVYCGFAGILFVYLSAGRKTTPKTIIRISEGID